MKRIKKLNDKLRRAVSELDCRIEHGASKEQLVPAVNDLWIIMCKLFRAVYR